MNSERGKLGASILVIASIALAAGGALGASAPAAEKAAPVPPSPTYRDLKWEALIPKGWDPAASFRNRNTTILSDNDPRSRKLLKEVKEIWDHAPTVEALNGTQVKIPGYIVPLETSHGVLREFLLVPYFGACIHTPPPPANQIIFVVAKTPAEGFRSMDTVWVSGTLTTTRVDTFAGSSGYKIDATVVERYVGAPTN